MLLRVATWRTCEKRVMILR